MTIEIEAPLPRGPVRPSPSRRRLPGILLIGWVATWLTITHVPAPPPGALPDWLSDKAIHFAGYAIMGVLTIWYEAGRGRVAAGDWILVPWVLLVILAAIDETTQPLVGRDCEWSDGVADALGAGAGLVVASLIVARWKRNVDTVS